MDDLSIGAFLLRQERNTIPESTNAEPELTQGERKSNDVVAFRYVSRYKYKSNFYDSSTCSMAREMKIRGDVEA